jgi:hypothetical protein
MIELSPSSIIASCDASPFSFQVLNVGQTATSWVVRVGYVDYGLQWAIASPTTGNLAPGEGVTVVVTPNADLCYTPGPPGDRSFGLEVDAPASQNPSLGMKVFVYTMHP